MNLLTDEGFEEYILSLDERLLATTLGRRALTELDPLAFAVLYLAKHLKSEQTGNRMSFADLHVALIEDARRWIEPRRRPREYRDAYVAPRETGKSTWLFLILPLWAAAHGHVRFIAAFANAGIQAQDHLQNFKHELETNELLRKDYPELCNPAMRRRGVTFGDSQREYQAESGFVFMARGIDTAVLGMKSAEARPDLIVLDDVEPDESNYSAYQMEKRLRTIQDAILPLNEFARVVLSGTVTMPGSIIHQLVKSVQRNDPPEPWVIEENFRVHYFPPIVTLQNGLDRSIWPAKWSLDYLTSIRHTRGYKKNFANDPMGYDGEYWRDVDFIYEELSGCPRSILSIDPTVTTKTTSDPAGIAVVSYKPASDNRPARVMVEHAEEVRVTGDGLRTHALKLLEMYPNIGRIYVESNQGGENWFDILHDMPVKVEIKHQTVKKEIRAGKVHNYYERGRVLHAKKLLAAEEQMVSYPRASHDDMVDAIGQGVLYFLDPTPQKRTRMTSASYV